MNNERKRERVLLFLYGELSAGEEAVFRTDLARDMVLKELLEEERRFDELYPSGETALVSDISDQQLAESRLLLRAALRGEKRRSRWADLWAGVVRANWLRPVATLALGALLGWGLAVGSEKPLAAVADGEVVDLRVRRFDEASGQVELSFVVLSEASLAGDVQSEAVQRLLASALQSGAQDADRLQAVDWLSVQQGRAETRSALIAALKSDSNPGVRLKAVEALASLAVEEEVRQVLRQALAEDANAGVRVTALGAISAYGDSETLDLMKRLMVRDDNPYIRAEARRVFESRKNESRKNAPSL